MTPNEHPSSRPSPLVGRGERVPAGRVRGVRALDGMRSTWRGVAWRHLLLAWVVVCSLEAVTLEDLRRDPELTPQKFAHYFRNFRYEYHDEIQPPEVFLSREAGDCDDYATLAADVLGAKGYHPRLIAVRMPGVTHVVCYITEISRYLDFNSRAYLSRTERAKPDLRDIARHVAKSFDASWTSASEFTYANGLKYMVATVTQTETYTSTAAAVPPVPASQVSKIKIDF